MSLFFECHWYDKIESKGSEWTLNYSVADTTCEEGGVGARLGRLKASEHSLREMYLFAYSVPSYTGF